MDKAQLIQVIRDTMAANGITLADLTPAPVPVPSTPLYPRVQVIDGVQFNLAAPINPLWLPNAMSQMIGGKFSGNNASKIVLKDPGSPPGARSPRGYPTFAGRPQFQDQSAATDDELEQIVHAVYRTPEQIAAANAAMEQNMREQHPGS